MDANLNVLAQLPGYVLWKDKHSIYLGCNLNFLKISGYGSIEQIQGKTDYDMPWGTTHAKHYITDDKYVIQSGKPMLQYIETIKRHQQWFSVYASKFPYYNDERSIEGVICHFYDLETLNMPKRTLQLSAVQRQCLHYLIQGYSAKQIAKNTGLSPRTIESYLEHLKNKLGCANKVELIKKGILLGL